RIIILNKKGLVFFINKYKNRLGFIIGALIFATVLIVLSNFVWIINVEGNTQIPTAEIIYSCKNIGIYEGILKDKINSKYDAQRLSLQQKGIAWCSLNLEGSVLTVNLSETAVSDKEQRQSPSNLKANFEGKIKKIDITSGNSIIKVGDTVSKGDLLVSGVVENLSSTLFVHSEGIVIAETKRTFSAEGKYTQTIEQKTGNSIKRFTLDFFNLKMPLYLGNIKQQHSYNADIKNLTLFNKKIPIKIACEKFDILQKTTVTYDKAILEDMLYKDIKNQVEKFDFISATEGQKDLTYTDKGILLKITYNCEENIAIQDKILLDTEN
ncbi:MAG: sporulation protein YqfD, partial [Clostridia bacterium]|nr:sporulation protein YqfD [Clostridia bacterium]